MIPLENVTAVLGMYGPVEQVRENRIRVSVPPEKIREALGKTRRELDCDHLIQISVADLGSMFELTYHMTGPHRSIISLAVDVPREKPEIPSTHDILPPAGIYERQIHDLMGIVFSGHPDLRRIILNEDWPEEEYPLRKDWKPDPERFYGGIREGQ